MIETLYPKIQDESADDYLIRLGNLKESKQINITWDEMALIMNSALQPDHPMTESYWRKKYHKLIEDYPDKLEKVDEAGNEPIRVLFNNIEKQRIRLQDERYGFNRLLRDQARKDNSFDLLKKEIKRYDAKPTQQINKEITYDNKVCYALLSDIHYGLTFSSFSGEYNSDIAKERILRYADEIINVGIKNNCPICFVSLMGDMISGNIHQTLRIENKENIIQQVVGVSELISQFLYKLACSFEQIYINNVDGNHSRIDSNLDLSLHTERLDNLIPWYCKAKLSNLKNVTFASNVFDSSIASFTIYDKLYVAVHGDLEKDLKTTSNSISKMFGSHIDCLLAAHTHVPEVRIEDTVYIRNGCVCGSGDDYTIKKRLYSPASQTCMICTENGVEAIYPIIL